ncbi:uncharacterized mitochondrial protein AtMg00810-like [Schistocerca piceifrons]|uniref:uncharacterized mitochondrial protein AtMg00810-like n=1 Tax=Schistocerca piceifrons TaxID=274613 RepID=UPI001F5F5E67|nr:uncharacterized mitochondrial protein AtMg00810-like [Schistocerca piceifrons]
MTDAKPISLPTEPDWIPGNSPPATDTNTYREIIGSLTYLTLGTLPDLAYAGTINDGISFRKTNNSDTEDYSDADYAGEKLTRRSTSGVLM